jgi:hypothetical protein
MGGVLATMHHHDQFVEKLKDTLVTIKWTFVEKISLQLNEHLLNRSRYR